MLGDFVAVYLTGLEELHEGGLHGPWSLTDIVHKADGEGGCSNEFAEIAEWEKLGEGVGAPLFFFLGGGFDDGWHAFEVGGVTDDGVHDDEIGLGTSGGLGDDIGLADAWSAFDENFEAMAEGVGEDFG
jgi:hypothetical protein